MDLAIAGLFWLRYLVIPGKEEWRRGRTEGGKEEHKRATGRKKKKNGKKKDRNQRKEAMKNKATSTHGDRKALNGFNMHQYSP